MDDIDSTSHIGDHRRFGDASRYAAVVVSGLLERWFETRTVLDLGCGTGSWLRGFAAGGRRYVFGVEQEHLAPQELQIDPELIVHADLSRHLDLHRRFDLVLCLEVAEHIPAEAAKTVVGNCIRHADFVLFSAALPGQQGHHHVNENRPEYWVELFAAQGYVVFDVLRPQIWDDASIPVWYRQNLLLFVRSDLPVVEQLQSDVDGIAARAPLNRAHPDLLAWFSREATRAEQAGAEANRATHEANRANQVVQRKLAETTAQLTTARSELKRASYALAVLRQEHAVITGSTIWRATGPLRRLGRALPMPVRRLLRRILRMAAAIARKVCSPRNTPRIATAPVAPVTGDSWRIVVISGESHSPGHLYRVVRFADAAKSVGARVLTITISEAAAHRGDLLAADFVMIWRATNTQEAATAIAAVRAGRAKLLVDVDDLMFVPELASETIIDGIRSQNLDTDEVAGFFLKVREVMAQADACICTTNGLAVHARELDKATFVLANGFDNDVHAASRLAVRRRRARQEDGLVRIGYAAGTRTHQRDFGPVAGPLARVLGENPTCRLVLFRDAETGRDMIDLDEFPSLLPHSEQIEWRDLVPLGELPEEMARFDINIAPLETGNPFCEAKSELKYFEAALVGVCTVASPTEPMRSAIRDGETGILVDTPEAWFEAVSSLVRDTALRHRLAHAAYLDVLWRYGPHRRADQLLSMLSQLNGGQDAARAFELEFRRHAATPSESLNIAPSETVFVADRLATAEISVVIPLYNYARYVTDALESVRAQTIGPLDLIVVDDCSTDDSLEVARSWAEREAQTGRFNRIIVMRNNVNSGLARTRNVGFDAAETNFVVPLDADNKLLPEFCAKALRVLSDTRAAFAYSKIQCFGDHDHVIGTCPFSPMRFAQANYVDAMALVAKWAWVAVGGYTHIQHGWEDYDFWCCCVEHGFWGIHVPEILAEYRFHDASMLRTITDIQHNKRQVVQQLETRHPWLSIVDRG